MFVYFSDKIVDIRGRGLMWGVEFADEFNSLHFVLSSVRNGVFCDYCGNHKATSKFLPPLVITEKEMTDLLSQISSALEGM